MLSFFRSGRAEADLARVAIGAGAAYLEFVNDLLHPTLPLKDGHRIVGIVNWDATSGSAEHRSVHDFMVWRQELERAMRNTHEKRKDVNPQLGIGLAWHIRTVGGRTLIFHSGSTAGSRTVIGFDPDKRVGLVLLTNSPNFTDQRFFFDLLAPPVARTEVSVPEAILETYVGEYEVRPERFMTITLENGALYTQLTGQQKFQLFAESETEFFLKVVDAQLTFTKDAAGVVTGAVLYQNGNERPARKVK